ncbi:hypothetical protein MRX96_036320 [Rhipicephalus microplus]
MTDSRMGDETSTYPRTKMISAGKLLPADDAVLKRGAAQWPTRCRATRDEGAHGDAKPTQEPQKPLTFSELLEFKTPLTTQEEQSLQSERSTGKLRSWTAWCHAAYWDYLG